MKILAAIGIALALAYCFAAVGDLALRRRSRDWSDWNGSFLAGCAMVSVTFFPLSLIARSGALITTLVGLICAGVVRLFIAPRCPRFPRWNVMASGGLVEILWLALLLFAFIQFNVENLRMSYFWDGYQIWATKALVIHQNGRLGQTWIAPGEQERLLQYPVLIPVFEALMAKARGFFAWSLFKPIFGIFYLSLLLGTYHAARAFLSHRLALAATGVVAILPAVSTRFAIGGYADMPLAAFVAAIIAGLMTVPPVSGWRNPSPWIIAGLLHVKNEGVILAGIVIVALCGAWIRSGRRRSLARSYAAGALVVVASFALRYLYGLWLGVKDLTYGPIDGAHIARALSNWLTVPRLCARELLNFSEWGAFWPAFFAAFCLLLLWGKARERVLAGATMAALLTYMLIFYFTNWDIELHITQAFSRLASQVSPAASISMLCAYAFLRGRGGRSAEQNLPAERS